MMNLSTSRVAGIYDAQVRFRGWRARSRLRPLVARPRSRAVLDRLGLIVGVLEVSVRRPVSAEQVEISIVKRLP